MPDPITFKDIHSDNSKKQVEKIYYKAFKKTERLPFEMMYKSSLREDVKMYAVYDKDEVIGFAYVILHNKLLYLEYVAVSDKYRDHGYGAEILEVLRETYPNKTIIIDIEAEQNDPVAYQKRKHFYLNNGFVETGLHLNLNEETEEEILSTDKSVHLDSQVMFELFDKQFHDYKSNYLKKHTPKID